MTGMRRTQSRRRFLKTASGLAALTGCLGGGWLMAGLGAATARPCLRPPGALDEEEFLSTCIRCGRCADACPNRCIVAFTDEAGRDLAARPGRGQRGTPAIFPRRQACMLCQGVPGEELLCTAACPTGALQLTRKDAASIHAGVKMGTAELDKNLCYSYNGSSCGVCVRACPLEGDALRAGLREVPIINPDSCVGCGLCERACIRYPQAIKVSPTVA
jgi:MauM/NapG family ferredoxin protein